MVCDYKDSVIDPTDRVIVNANTFKPVSVGEEYAALSRSSSLLWFLASLPVSRLHSISHIIFEA